MTGQMYRIKLNGGCKLYRRKSTWKKGSSREQVKTSAGGVEGKQTEFYCPNALDATGKISTCILLIVDHNENIKQQVLSLC